MGKLTPSQKAKLEALWRTMPAHTRTALIAAAQGGGGGGDQRLIDVFKELEESIREPAGDKAKGYLLQPLKPLVGDPALVPPSKSRFNPDQVGKIWGWLTRQLATQTVETAKKCKQPPTEQIGRAHV